MSVNFGGTTSDAGEDAAEGDDGLVVGVPGKFGVSGAGEVEACAGKRGRWCLGQGTPVASKKNDG